MKYLNKLTAVSIAVASALSCAANADVMITEYVEGSSSNKAIELYNSGISPVDLIGYKLVRYKDGATEASSMGTIGDVTLGAGEVLVVKHSSLSLDGVNTINIGLNFNGGDAVALTNGTTIIDVVGAVPTPSSWGKDTTIQRSADSTMAKTVFDESEWTAQAKDTFSGLGKFGGEVVLPDPFSCEGATLVPVHQIQGEGYKSPLVAEGKYESDEVITVRGVVTARGESLQKGFYIQDIEVDGDSATSDGIFVYMNTAAPAAIQPGVEVCLEAKVKEFFGQTQLDLSKDTNKIEIGEAGDAPVAVPFVVGDEENLDQALERYEGMKIVLDAGSEMKVTRSFSFDYAGRRNNMVLSHQAPLHKATQLYMAGSEGAVAHQAANRQNELFLESDYKAVNGVVPYMSDFNAETGYIRIGDQLTNLEGVVGYNYSEYRLIVGADESITAGDILRGDYRVDTPAVASEGDLRVASFNVLNYFNDSVGGDASASGQNRGTEDQFEFRLQREKIVNAIISMNADIVGLMEIENNGFGDNSAIQDLVSALNDELSDENAYSFVEVIDADKYNEKYLGSDAIMVGLLYRAANVTPNGDALVVETPEQHAPKGAATRGEDGSEEQSPAYNKYQRHSLAQTFTVGDEKLTVVVNHFKSKGSECLEDWIGGFEDDDPTDLQGHCNNFRVSAADAVGSALTNIEGDVLILGDLNSYGMEDPLQILTDYHPSTHGKVIKTAAHTTLAGETYDVKQRVVTESYGYVNLNTKLHGADSYGYSYSGELGNLDHALANAELADKVIAIEDWHINAVESNMFEYSSEYTGDLVKSGNAFSSSDHDPVIIAIDLPDPVVTPEPEAPKKKSSGSLGFLGLALLSLFGIRRRR